MIIIVIIIIKRVSDRSGKWSPQLDFLLETDVRRKMTSVLCQSPILEDWPINRHYEISSFCIHVIKCLSDTNLIPNPKEVVANEALGLKGNTMWRLYTGAWILLFSWIGHVCVCDLRVTVKFLFLSHPFCSLFLSGVAHVWGQKVSRFLHLVV